MSKINKNKILEYLIDKRDAKRHKRRCRNAIKYIKPYVSKNIQLTNDELLYLNYKQHINKQFKNAGKF